MGLSSRLLLLGALLVGSGATQAGAQAPTQAFASVSVESKGKVFLTKEEALALAFQDCEVQRSTVYLTAAQRKRVDELAGFEVSTPIAYTYRATRGDRLVGYAWFDSSKVRTKKQSVMFVVSPAGLIERFELLAFGEPSDYIPRANWYAQLLGKRLDKELQLKRSIKSVTGATLTAHATVDAARRVLALQETLFPRPQPQQAPGAAPSLER